MSFNTFKFLDRLHRLRASTHSPEDQEALEAAIDALHFIGSMGKVHAFEDYRVSIRSNVLPPPLCSFNTREEADAWLLSHPEPPHGASVSIGDERYTVASSRQFGHRALLRIPSDEEPERGGGKEDEP